MPTPTFGHVGSAQPGDLFASRLELSLRGQHRPRRAGVCATAQEGAESITLADQYEDDEVHDDYFWYADLTYRNQGLIRSQETGRPVRVFRRVAVAPEPWQFRYEGLWHVVAHVYATGKSGYKVYRFPLEPWVES